MYTVCSFQTFVLEVIFGTALVGNDSDLFYPDYGISMFVYVSLDYPILTSYVCPCLGYLNLTFYACLFHGYQISIFFHNCLFYKAQYDNHALADYVIVISLCNLNVSVHYFWARGFFLRCLKIRFLIFWSLFHYHHCLQMVPPRGVLHTGFDACVESSKISQ